MNKTRFTNSQARRASRVLPLLAFVIAPLGTIGALAATAVPVTGSVVGGSLTATYPAAVAFGSSNTAGVAGQLNLTAPTGLLGAVTVTDTRGSTGGAWTTSATLTDFAETGSPSTTIASKTVSVTPNAIISAPTNPTGTTASAGAGGAFTTNSTAVVFMSATGNAGLGTYALNPTFTWTPPANAVIGAYTATMTFTTQ